MKVLFINSHCGAGSTGKICTELAEKFEADGNEVKIAYGRYAYVPEQYKKYAVRIGSDLEVKINAFLTRITDKEGLYSKNSTKKFLKWAEEFNPDVLWIHNLHSYFLNYEMLFEWIKKRPQMQVKWTLHDCWPFTGHCAHFTVAKCYKWQTECKNCLQKTSYPASFIFSNCNDNFNKKKQAFTGVKNMTIITPSKWLANLVKESFLKEYFVEVIHNTIDTNVFKPTPSNFRERYGLENKKIILGVSGVWNERKGFNDFIELSKMLDKNYRIVLVGLNDKQLKEIPENIIGIKHTNGQKELAEIYTAADVFVSLSYEENYPTVHLEARACGTPVITYDAGGSSEAGGEDAKVADVGDLKTAFKLIMQCLFKIEKDSE